LLLLVFAVILSEGSLYWSLLLHFSPQSCQAPETQNIDKNPTNTGDLNSQTVAYFPLPIN
jgi:hypothetical protein